MRILPILELIEPLMKPTKVTLTFDNGAPPIELPMLAGNLGPDAS